MLVQHVSCRRRSLTRLQRGVAGLVRGGSSEEERDDQNARKKTPGFARRASIYKLAHTWRRKSRGVVGMCAPESDVANRKRLLFEIIGVLSGGIWVSRIRWSVKARSYTQTWLIDWHNSSGSKCERSSVRYSPLQSIRKQRYCKHRFWLTFRDSFVHVTFSFLFTLVHFVG